MIFPAEVSNETVTPMLVAVRDFTLVVLAAQIVALAAPPYRRKLLGRVVTLVLWLAFVFYAAVGVFISSYCEANCPKTDRGAVVDIIVFVGLADLIVLALCVPHLRVAFRAGWGVVKSNWPP